MAAQQVGSLYLEVFLDPTQYYAQIQAVEKRAREMATRIEREWKQAPLRPRVDDRELTDLNRHLDLKRRHYSEVRNYIERNPIKIKVDDRQLNKQVIPSNKTIKVDVQYKVSGMAPVIKDSKIIIDAQFNKADARIFTKEIGDELEKAGERVSRGIKKSTKSISGGDGLFGALTAVPKTIARGFYEGVGMTYSQQLTSGFIKGIEGKFGKSLDSIGQMTSDKLLKAGKVGGDVLLKKLGIPEGTAGVKARVNQVNNVLQDLFPADAIENKLNRVEKRIDKLLDSLLGLKSGAENLNNLAALGQEIGGIGQIPFEKLKKDRANAIQSVASQIRAEQKQNPIKVDIPQEAERVVFAVGGFAGQKGQSANNFVAKKLGMLLGERSAVMPVSNPYSDVSASVGDVGALRWSTEAAFKTLKTPLTQKINPDAVSMAKQAYAAYQQDPSKPIRLAGYSYGGQIANDALEILQQLGVKDVKAVGIGSPSFGKLSQSKASNFAVTLGKGDGVKRLQDIGAFFAGGVGKGVNVTPVQGHELSSYLADPKSQEIILKQIEGSGAKLRKELQNPDAFRLVDYQKNIEKIMVGLENLLTNPIADPNLQKQLMSANLDAIKSTKSDLDEALKGLSESVGETIQEHYQALVDAESVLNDLLGVGKKAPVAPKIDEQAAKAAKQRQELEQTMLTFNKKDIIEPIGKELGIKDVRNTHKQELINKILNVADPAALKTLLPHSTPPSAETMAASTANLQMPVNALKSHLKTQREQIVKLMNVNPGNKTGSQLIDISSAIEKEYQTIILSLSQGVSGGAKKVLESAKLEIGQLRAKALREATEQTAKQANQISQASTVSQQVTELARVSNKDEESFVTKFIGGFTRRTQKNIQANYELLLKSIAKESGARLKKTDIPKLIVDDERLNKLGVSALYNFQKNQIVVSKQVEEILKKSPQALINYQEKLKDIVHEARHAFQFDFGRLSLTDFMQGASSPIKLTPENQMTAKSAAFGQKSAEIANKRAGGKLSPEFMKVLQSVEGDAYNFEEQTQKIVTNAAKLATPFKTASTNLQSFLQGIGEAQSSVSNFTDLGIELFKEFAGSLPNGAILVHLAENLGAVKAAAIPLLKLFVGFAVIGTAINLFRGFATESLKVAANLEALEKRIQFAAGSKQQGNVANQELRAQSERFGINRQATLEQGAGFLAVTRETPVEGERSLKILESLNQASRVYNLTIEQQGRAQVALQQIVSKGVVSQEELRGQLSEAIPGAAQVAARAYGVTVQELNRMVTAGLDGAEFVQKFASQLGNETAGGLAGALTTTQARAAKFENSLLNLQEATGKALLPLQNIALSALTTGLDLINKSLPILLTLLATLATRLAVVSAQALGQLITQLLASRAAMFALGNAAQVVGNLILTSFKQFAGFAVIGIAINTLINQFRDLSGEIRGQVDAVKNLQNEYNQLISAANKAPKQVDDAKVLGDRIKRAIPDLVTGKGEEIKDSFTAIRDSRKLTPQIIATSQSSEAQRYIEQIRAIDKEVEKVNIRRRALVQSNPGDTEGLRALQKQEKSLFDQRTQAEKVPDNIKQQLQAQADAIKNQLDYLEQLKKEYPLYGEEVDNVNKGISKLKQDYENIIKAQTDLNKAISKGSDAFSIMRKNITAVANDLADTTDKISLFGNQTKAALSKDSLSGAITPGQEQFANAGLDIQQLEKLIKAQSAAVTQTRALLNTDQNNEIMRARGINNNTGRARLNSLAEGTTNPQEKFLFEQLASLQQQKLDISNLEVQIAQARANAQKQLIDLTKQVADYYRGIERNAQQQAIEIQRASKQVQVTQQQNKLRSALLDGYDTIVSQFIDSIIDSIGQFNQVGDRALEAQSQLLNNRFNLEDTLRSGVELSRNLPTVPIKLDFSGIPADNNIAELGHQVQEAIDGSNDLGESINGATSNADDLYKQLIENLKPLDDANKTLTDTASNFDSVNQKAQESGDLAKQFGGELGAIPSQVASIDQGFVGIVASLGTIIAKTVEWLTNLGSAKETLDGIANNVSQSPLGQGLQQIGQGILQAGSYGIASPSTTQSLEQVLKGTVSQGQGFFGQRARGNHASIDFDGTEGLGGGAAFQAMFPGRVASTRAWGNGYRDVDGGNSNAIRIISKLPGGLGEFSTDYGHYKASTAKVQEGQDILAGTKLGALSQKDSISSGGHLDLKIRIPSTIANQFKTTQSAGGGQSFVEVKEFMRWYQGQLGNASKQQTLPMTGASNIQSSAPQGGISRGGNPLSPAELARLTKEGQQLYQLQRNPNVLAFADVVARAEGTDFRNNSKNFGYSMMIGGEHDTNLSRHPFAGNSGSRIRAPRHNSTASGRYQMMDFNYSRTQAERQFGRGAKSDLASVFQGENPGSFSPGVQDLYFTASLKSRGILDEVLAGDFESALKNPNIAKHYASLQSGTARSAHKGQGTPEGQLKNTIPFAQQRLMARRREGAPVSVAADNFSAATPGQMRNGVLQGMNLAVQTAQQGGQRETLITKQSEADQERARQEAVRKANQALRQYERARRDQEDRSITNQRGVTDFGISAIKNPSPAQRRLQESTQIKRQSDDLIKEREREIENRQKQIEQSQEILRNKSYLAAPNAAEVETQLKQGIKENEKEIPRLAKQIDEIKKIGADYQKNVEAIFAREDNQRRQTADFEAFQGEIAKAQKQLEGLQQLQQVSPLDVRVFDIPALQEEIELKQAALDLDKAIFDEENKLYNYTINQQEFDRRIEQIKQENIVRQENAIARRQQAEAEQELQKVQRQLEVRAQATSMNNEYLQNMMQLRQLGKGGRNPLDIQREMNLAQMDSDFAQREFEINRNRNRTPEERERELESLRQIRQSRTDVINAELARNQEDNQIAARDLFNKSNLDVVGAQASNMRVFGQDNRARQLEKGMAVFQQQTAFQDQIRELERLAQTNEEVAKSADLIRANYEELNKIKLDEIENQFNEFLPAIQEIKGATQGLFSDLLSGADDAFANFGKKILDYFTQLAAQMLTNDLFGAIGGAFGMKGQQSGGGGGQIFDLLGGLLGGLFYNGGYVPNYAKGYNPLQDALKREHAQTGKRAYVAVLSEGERVLNIDETRKFHAMGGDNILRFAEGGMVGATSSFSPTSGGNVSVNNNIVIGGNSENTDVGAFRTVLDGRIREIIREEQRPGRSLNRKRR